MAAKSRPNRSVTDIPVVGPREPCPCGSGKRYKVCHGKRSRLTAESPPSRPFEGLPGECDWIALREIVPSGTAPLRLRGDDAHRNVTLATVLPLAVGALVRRNGDVYVGLQTAAGSGDPSRDVAYALEAALRSEPGSMIAPSGQPGAGRRLQDLLDLEAPLAVTVHETFDFWIDEEEEAPSADVAASLEQANAMAAPTARLRSVEAAYWCRIGDRDQVRWVLPHDEEPLLDALARLHAAGADSLNPGSRLLGTFRAGGLLVPVWDLPDGTAATDLEEPAQSFVLRLTEALAIEQQLTGEERRARAGLANRQITLR